MAEPHSRKCIIYANLYILNMPKKLTYHSVRSAGCVIGKTIKIAF